MRIDIDDILAPRGRPQRRDELADSAAKIAREQAAERVSGGLLLSGPPEATAKANQLSRSLGVPAPVIDGNLAAMERRQQTEQFVSTSMRFAGMASWASDPRNAAIGVDDWENLGLLGKTWETAKQFTTGALPSLASGLFGGLADNAESLIGAASDVADAFDPKVAILGFASDAINKVFGTDIRMDKDAQDTQDLLRGGQRKRQEALKVEANAWRPQSTSWIARDLLKGVESVPLTLTAILTRDPKAAAGVMGALSGAGSYGDARAQGLDLGASLAYGARQGFVEVITEKMPASKLLGDIASRTPFGKMIATQLAQEIPGEQAATFLQDLDEWVTLNPSKSLKEFALERPSAAAQTLLATIGGVGVTTGTISATTKALDTVTKVATKRAQAAQAEREGTVIDKLGDAAVNSKIRQRDPEAFAALIREMAENGANDLYVDGEAVRAYMQSDSFDPEGPWAEYIDQSSEAFATGADIVIPVEKALTDLAGTPVWEALKNNMRFSPGGASRSEAEQFNAEVADLEAMLPEEDVDARAEREFATARDNLAGSIATKLMDAGYTPTIARTQAELVATRYATRAARKGQPLTGKEYDDVEIRQVLPEKLALAQRNDGIDAVIEEMRRQGKGEGAGPSLAEFIAKRGGIEDAGGDLASMGADKWHVGKPGRRKLIKPFDKNQGSMLATDGPRDTQIERVFQAAIDAGYFPELEGVDRSKAADALDNNMLLEALGAELSGTKRFAKSIDTTLADNAAELDRILRERGVDPKTATRKQIRAALDEYSQQEEAAGYEQSYGDGPRGRVIFNQGRTVIELFETRNLSTFLHETSHMWLEELRFDAMDPDAPDQLKADWKLVEKWFSDNGHPIKDGVIPVEAHEMFARGGEQYFMEGKSPTGPLKGVFEQFRQWLNSIYRTVKALRTPLSPEIREVFDRLIATDQDLEFTAAEQAMSPLFKEAEGMSKAEYNAYVRLASDARTDARAMLLDKTTREIRARETKQYKSIAEGVRAEVAESVDARPAFRAMAAMKQAPMDRQWVVDTMGDETALLLPRAVPPLYKNGGVHPDTIAEQSGFATGRDMIEALTAIEIAHRTAREEGDKRGLRERIIEEEVSEVMRQRYGDPLTDGSIEREALAAVHNEMAGEVIAAEVRVLARRTGNRPTPYAIARNWARNKVRTGIISQEAMPGAIQRHARAAAKAGREAEKAYLAQDIEEAFRFKQSQMIHNALLSEAKKALDEVDAARRRLDKIAARPTMKSVDQGYLEQAHGLLEAVDLKRRSMVQVDRKEAFEKWVNSRADGEEVLVPESFDWSGTNWTRMTVEAMLGLDDTVKSIIHLGRLKQTLLDNKERREFDDWKEEALAGIEATPGRKITNELGDPSRPVAGIFANLMKMEVFASEMDNAKADGVWQRLLVQRSTEAANYRDQMRDEVLNPIAEAYNALPTKTRDRMAERITIPEMPWRSADPNDPRNGTPQIRTRWDVVGMALNLGTSSNLDKLARGYGISEQVAEDIVRRELTKEEWDFVQGVWDSLNLLRPHIARVEREMTGVEPEWQEPREVETPFGTLKGGYYPVKYDPAQSQQAEDYDNDSVADLFGKQSGVATSKGHTIARTDYAAPLLLSPEQVLFTHVEKIITRNAYAPWVRDVLKAVKQPSIRAAIDRKFGAEFRQQIEPWLRQQVREGIVNESGARFAEKFLRSARVNLTVVAMGLRWSTGLAQIIGLGNSVGRIGANNLRRGMQRMLANPSKAAEFVFARSPEMERRNESMNRDVAEAFRQMRSARMSGSATLRKAKAAQAKAQAFAFWHIGMIDRYVVSIPTWLGAYEKATREGMDDVKASAYADKMVRLSQGSGREKDLSAWQSNQTSEGLKFFTMFYTPFNVLLNTQWEAGRAARRGDWRKASSLAFWFMIATPLLDAMLAGDTPWDDDDEEGWATWLARNVGFYQFAGVPIVRDATNYAERKMIGQFATFSPGPIGRIFDATEDAGTLAWDATLGEDEVSDRWLRTAIETPGYFLGLPTGQVAQTGNFLKDVSLGEADPEGFWDWYTGLTKGKIED
jgi:hypothetical protein